MNVYYDIEIQRKNDRLAVYATWLDYHKVTNHGALVTGLRYEAEIKEMLVSHLASPVGGIDPWANNMYDSAGVSGFVGALRYRGVRPSLYKLKIHKKIYYEKEWKRKYMMIE